MTNQDDQSQIDKLIARVIVTYNNKALIVRRSMTDKTRQGVWELPGGGVDSGESFDDAAKREVLEETGLTIKNIKYLHSTQYKHPVDGSKRMGVVFHAEATNDVVKLSFEHDDYQWVSTSNINNIEMDAKHKEHLLEYFSNGEQSQLFVEKHTTKADAVIVFTDGGSRGNPGPSASGYVIMDQSEQILLEGGEYLGITTNNQAEYHAVKTALEECQRLGAKNVEFYIDSLLVVNQMNGIYKIKNRDLWPIHERIKELAKSFESVSYTHVRREKNKLADAKVNEVLDNHQ